ncbi:MAG: ABC transporter transmembrane domain-containing protein, partial [Candidatus Babeliales bacterium]
MSHSKSPAPSFLTLNQYVLLFISRYRSYLGALICLASAAGIFEILVEYQIKEIIDAITAHKNNKISYLIVLFIAYKLVHHGIYFFSRLSNLIFQPRISEESLIDIYTATIKHSLHWFDSHLSGEVSGKIFDFQYGIATLTEYFFCTLTTIITIVIMLYFLISINIIPALVLLLFIIIYTPTLYILIQKQMYLQKAQTSARQKTFGTVNDSIANIFSIKVIGSTRQEFHRTIQPTIEIWKDWITKTLRFETYF